MRAAFHMKGRDKGTVSNNGITRPAAAVRENDSKDHIIMQITLDESKLIQRINVSTYVGFSGIHVLFCVKSLFVPVWAVGRRVGDEGVHTPGEASNKKVIFESACIQ